MGKFNLIEYIKREFNKYKTYYQILGINPDNINDEIVKKAYDNKCMQLNNILKDCKPEEAQEIRELIQTALDNAYTALKTDNSRKHDDELLNKIDSSPEL